MTVAVATFGAGGWSRMAQHALESVPYGVPSVHVHERDGTLATSRNAALAQVETEWVVHLDADDRLGDGYIDAMATGSADLRGPALMRTRGHAEMDAVPFLPRVAGHSHQCVAECLRYGNWLVIGTCARTALLREVGGWEEWGWSEDWALWARAWRAGATVEAVPEAVYRAKWRSGSRNKMGRGTSVRWHRAIEEAVWPDEESTL